MYVKDWGVVRRQIILNRKIFCRTKLCHSFSGRILLGVIAILFGVSGAGQTTLGQLLADELGWKFYEGDHFHSQVNLDKMHAGVPLTDEDGQPWLEFAWTDRTMFGAKKCGPNLFGAKKSYRSSVNEVQFVYHAVATSGSRPTSATARTFHEPGVTEKSVRHSGGTGSRRRRNCNRAWGNPRELVDRSRKSCALIRRKQLSESGNHQPRKNLKAFLASRFASMRATCSTADARSSTSPPISVPPRSRRGNHQLSAPSVAYTAHECRRRARGW